MALCISHFPAAHLSRESISIGISTVEGRVWLNLHVSTRIKIVDRCDATSIISTSTFISSHCHPHLPSLISTCIVNCYWNPVPALSL
uniref:Uncharacterized protein n=1 Tax=Octopus bimaculoides TaxID=37653 RepID=A0A0L8I1X2_OCTBM